MKKTPWLITAFEPFAGRKTNNSRTVLEEIRKLVADLEPGDSWPFRFYYQVLPVEYDRCFSVMTGELERLHAEGVRIKGILSLGEAAEDFKIETLAHNLDDLPELADNAGVVRGKKKIISEKDAPDTLKLRFPFEAFSRIRSSVHAGSFVCNHLCFRATHAFGANPEKPQFGFIHVPRENEGGIFTAEICAAMIVNGFRKIPAVAERQPEAPCAQGAAE